MRLKVGLGAVHFVVHHTSVARPGGSSRSSERPEACQCVRGRRRVGQDALRGRHMKDPCRDREPQCSHYAAAGAGGSAVEIK